MVNAALEFARLFDAARGIAALFARRQDLDEAHALHGGVPPVLACSRFGHELVAAAALPSILHLPGRRPFVSRARPWEEAVDAVRGTGTVDRGLLPVLADLIHLSSELGLVSYCLGVSLGRCCGSWRLTGWPR